MSDLVFAIPYTNFAEADDLRRLLRIADLAGDLVDALGWPAGDFTDQRIIELEAELSPLLAAHRQTHRRIGHNDAGVTIPDPAQFPRLRRDPFDADARTIAGVTPDDPDDTSPIIAFL